jgi:hypothetical protein
MHMVLMKCIVPLIIFSWAFAKLAEGQIRFSHSSLEMRNGGDRLDLATAGGLNSPQFGKLDVNLDGTPDLVIYDRTSAKINVFVVEGEAYRHTTDYDHIFPDDLDGFVVFRDFNCDGKQDIFTNTSFGIKVYKNISADSSGLAFALEKEFLETFSNDRFINLQVNVTDIPGIADEDNDGDLDIFVYNFATGGFIRFHKNLSMEMFGTCDSLYFELNDREWGAFEECDCEVVVFDGETCPGINGRLEHAGGKSLLLFDFDGDQDKDVVIGQEQCPDLYYLENTGVPQNEEFSSFTKDFPSSESRIDFFNFPAVFFEDVDLDGKKDLISAPNLKENIAQNVDFSESAWFYKNTGTPTAPKFDFVSKNFLQSEMIDHGQNSVPLIFDVNRDGLKDLLISNQGKLMEGNFISSILYFRNTGTPELPEFLLESNDFMGFSSEEITDLVISSGDIDNNGITDIIFTYARGGQAEARFFQGDTDWFAAGFQDAIRINVEVNPGDQILTDKVNNDEFTDLIIASQSLFGGQLKLFTGNPAGYTLSDDSYLGLAESFDNKNISLALADVDRDGTADILTSDFFGELKLFTDHINFNPDNQEALKQVVFNSITGQAEGGKFGEKTYLTLGDLNNDLLPDLVIGNLQGGIWYFMNQTVRTSIPEGKKELVQIYPNPVLSSQELKIQVFEACFIEIISIFGATMTGEIYSSGNETIELNVNSYPSGVYLIKVITSREESVKRFLVLN